MPVFGEVANSMQGETCNLHGPFKEVSILAIRLLCVEGNRGTVRLWDLPYPNFMFKLGVNDLYNYKSSVVMIDYISAKNSSTKPWAL